ncbi:MAG: hypothetical protein IJ629_04165 [Clostridia bacterium]|nr:hypothetical protein [Clostridia bacterium]
MKVTKKILSVIVIFMMIQLVFINNYSFASSGDSFFEKTFKQGKSWRDMSGGNSSAVLNNATGVTTAIDDIYNGIRAIGIGVFMVNIAFLFITLSMKNNGKDVAGAKLTITFSFILALLFIFAQNIMGFFTNIFEQFESIM